MIATVHSLRAEYGTAHFGGDVSRPRLSWKIEADSSWRSRQYQVQLMHPGEPAKTSPAIESADQLFVPWPFDDLASRERVAVRVRAWGAETPTEWSDPLALEMGLLERSDWHASLIRAPQLSDGVPYLRREFNVGPGLKLARAYVTGQGVFDLHLNGQSVLPDVMPPGWTSYSSRLAYRTVDIGGFLTEGPNAVGAVLGDGWYRGRLAWGAGVTNVYGTELGLIAQVELLYEDGRREVIATDASWRCGTGGLVASSLYDGETYDARFEPGGWDKPGFDDAAWNAVLVEDLPAAELVAHWRAPVVVMDERAPVEIFSSPSGKRLVDFGQIVTGRLRLETTAARGTRIRLRHAEVLENGELGVRPLRTAKATDEYVCSGEGKEVWEPRFTMHGFRYAEIDSDADVKVVARICYTDFPSTGSFACSNPLITKLHENVLWSLRGNFTHVPTDCAQRDERLGWAGDALMIAPAASFMFDADAFYTYWLEDLALDQRQDGTVPMVIPSVPLAHFPGSYPVTGWGDAAALMPQVLYERYADRAVLERQWESAARWAEAEALEVFEPGSYVNGFQFGDWLDPLAPPEHPEDGRTDPRIVMALYAIRSCDAVAHAAVVLGRPDEVRRFKEKGAELREVFRKRYVTDAGLVVSDSQSGLAMALAYDALPAELRPAAIERLVHVIGRDRKALRVGMLGASVLLDVLTDSGHADLAYTLLLREQVPSWLYAVKMGATTIWERWDSMLPDGSINPGDMTSFSHYAFGAVADWIQRRIGGIAPAAPGYQVIRFAPVPGGNIDWAEAQFESRYGKVSSRWQVTDGVLDLTVSVPGGATGIVSSPDGEFRQTVGPGTHHFSWAIQPGSRRNQTAPDV